jgi:lysophospholipase L1-like esterase
MKKYFYLFAFAALAALFVLGCEDRSDIASVEPVLNGKSGNADLSRFVVIGNSLAAGYQSAALYESAQIYSFGNLLAKQVNTKFEMPLISDPGTGGRMEIQALTSTGALIVNNPATGLPKNLNYPAPYNNLGIPGALTYDVLFATNSTNCASAVFANTPNPLFDLILRNQGATQLTQLQQALAQQPTFVILWIGNNDVLGYATSGGVSPSAPTPVDQFTQLYGGISQQLAANPGRQVVVANIPNVTSIPFMTTVGPLMASNSAIPWSSLPFGLAYQKAGESGVGTGAASQQDLLTGAVLITLRGSTYAGLLGQSTGKFYRDNNITTLPPGVDTTQAFGFHPQNPWPNSLILDPDEINIAMTRTAAFNAVIQNVASNFNFGLVDVNTLFNTIRQSDAGSGYRVDGITFRTTYVSGGLFSLDGVHPTNQGHAIVANEFIKVINNKYNAKIPAIQVSQIPPSLKFTGKIGDKFGYPQVPPEAFDRLLF